MACCVLLFGYKLPSKKRGRLALATSSDASEISTSNRSVMARGVYQEYFCLSRAYGADGWRAASSSSKSVMPLTQTPSSTFTGILAN
jgi:hypothetical protein